MNESNPLNRIPPSKEIVQRLGEITAERRALLSLLKIAKQKERLPAGTPLSNGAREGANAG